MSFDVKIDELHKEGLLKNHKHPFFIFKDNRTPSNFLFCETNMSKKKSVLEKIINTNYNQYAQYCVYLPRVDTFNLIESHPEIEKYFDKSKEALNKFEKFQLNSTISEKEDLDWFIYDDESMKFLLKMQKMNIKVLSQFKYIKGKLYFQDMCENQILTEEDLTKVFINVIIKLKGAQNEKYDNTYTKKLKISMKTTAFDVIEKIGQTVKKIKQDVKFDSRKKILKVKSLNDYIFSINEPLVKFTYITECVKENRQAEYCVIDNPLENGEEEQINNSLPTSSNRFGELLSIATHESHQDENGLNVNDYLNVGVNNSKQNDVIFDFINDLTKCVNNNTKQLYSQMKDIQKPTKEQDYLNFDGTKDYYEEDINTLNQRISHNNNILNHIDLNQFSFLALNTTSPNINSKKLFNKNIEPNIYIEKQKQSINMNKIFQEHTAPLNIKDIDRPFSIIIRNANLKQIYNSYPFDKNSVYTVMLFICQIYCGNEQFSNPKQLKWKTKSSDINPVFNKRIYFDINYSSLPNFASILFKVKFIEYNKSQEVIHNDIVGWANFRLFDHHKRLKTGMHKLNLFDRPFSDNSYFCFTDSNEEMCSDLFFEIESFAQPIVNKVIHIKNFKQKTMSISMTGNDAFKIEEIQSKSPFDDLNNYDKEILWRNRYSLAKMPHIVPKLLSCFNYTDLKHLIELEKVFELAGELSPVQALELLSGKFLHESIRSFAVKSLRKAPWLQVSGYLIQLVQGLKHEMDHDSELARYLLTLAINYPLTIGHSFFWSLRSEMYNQNVQQRFGLYLEVFLSKIGETLSSIFKDESFLIKELLQISDIPNVQRKNKDETKIEFKKALKKFNEHLTERNLEISIPLNFKHRIIGIEVDKCRIMKSKKKPLWLHFKNADELGDEVVVMFKKGDDLRMDLVTLQLFKAMQSIWFERKLNLKMSLYGVICTGFNMGMLEMVMNSETLAQIHIQEGGALQTFFSKTSLKNWIETTSKLPVEEYTDNFLLSTVAYCAATFVLGIGDRHNGNIMLKHNGELFHIDFGHFLGHFKYKMGIKRERAPFVFTKQFQSVLGGEKGEKFLEFKKKFWEAYRELRRNSDTIVTLLRTLLCTGIRELDEKSIKYLEQSLALKMKEEDSKKFLENKLNESINSMSTKVNFAIHIVANK